MTRIEEATNEQLNVLVAERVMEWTRHKHGATWQTKDGDTVMDWFLPEPYTRPEHWWQPSTNIACAFQVDKPEWEWWDDATDHHGFLTVGLQWEQTPGFWQSFEVSVPLDPANKTAAYCRGRVLCALKACGVEEV